MEFTKLFENINHMDVIFRLVPTSLLYKILTF